MVIHEKNLPQIIELSSQINYWEQLAARARALPLTHAMWLEGEGETAVTNWAHEALNLDAQAFHDLMVNGVNAYTAAKIRPLREQLRRMGIMTDDAPVAVDPPPQPLAITDQSKKVEDLKPGKGNPSIPTRRKRRAA